MENDLGTFPRASSSASLSKEFGSLSIEYGSLDELIKLALQEFDEKGCIFSPPPVTVVLLTMHAWYVTSRELLGKLIKIYDKNKDINGASPLPGAEKDLDVFENSSSLSFRHGNEDRKHLTSIAESKESGDESTTEQEGGNVDDLKIPKVMLNGALSESKVYSTDGEKVKVRRHRSGVSKTVERANTDNNNETSEFVSTVSAPAFFGVAIDESYNVARAQIEEAVAVQTPEVKIACVEEELCDVKLKDGSVHELQDDNGDDNNKKTEEMNHVTSSSVQDFVQPSENDQVINMWIVCQFLNYWMSKFGMHLRADDNVLLDIGQFKKSLIDENHEYEKEIRYLIGRKVLVDNELSGHSSRLVRQREVSRTKSLAFNDLTPKDIAEQLTHMDCRSLKKIPMSEWKTYARKTKLNSAPNLEKNVVRFNGLSRWIEAMVLNRETPEARAHIIEKFLNVAQCLRSHQNFNSLMAVIGALNHSAIRRLHQTTLLLSENKQKFLKEMTEFLSSEGNYANYRRELSKCVGFYVPILGVHLKDLIAVDTALPDFVTDKKLINFQKMVKFYSVIATLMNFKNMQPPSASKHELIKMLGLSIQMTITEDELYELSYAREPRKEGSLPFSEKAERGDSQLFADWASGRVVSPDSKTIDRHVTSMVEAVFKFYDRDSDGLLTTDDFEAISTNFPFIDAFGVVDANRDGVVTKEEMKSYFLKANYRALGRDFIHDFQETTYLTPNFCEHCGGVLWGLIRQGFKCKDCGINCHKACKGQVVIDCRAKTLAPGSQYLNTSTLERAASKADAIRSKWRHKRKSRIVNSEQENLVKEAPVTKDEIDNVDAKPDDLDEVNKALREENERLKDENESLRNDLNETLEKVGNLESQLKLVRQETITFVLEQLDALQLRRNTAV